jgi:hypothetical protein
MKLCALADVVTKLMLRNPTYEWKPEMKDLPCQLESMSVDELLQVSSFFHLTRFSAHVTEYHLYPSNMRRGVEVVGQCSQQDCVSRYQILLEIRNHMYYHLKLLNVVFYEMATMLFMNLIGRAIPNIGNDEKKAGNSRAFGPSKFGPTLSSKGQSISNCSTEMEDICTIFSAPSNNRLNSYKLSASITTLAKILKQG